MKPAKCRCGAKAEIEETYMSSGYYVMCSKDAGCWSGPTRQTSDEAVASWDLVMKPRGRRGARDA
jgi:hypothetical protein